MNRSLVALAIPAMALCGCSAPELPAPADGAKPITFITPSSSPITTTAAPAPSSTDPLLTSTESSIERTSEPVPPHLLPRDTNYNHADVEYAAETAIRSERIVQAAQLYLARPNIAAAGKKLAEQQLAEHEQYRDEVQEYLTAWGISNPALIFPSSPEGIPTEQDVANVGEASGPEADNAFATLLARNLEGTAKSAQKVVNSGFNPDLRAKAQHTLDSLAQVQAAVTALRG